ncbi:hypothetical protein ACH5RR_033617 [Cinchona calisaya]|uniref:Uncharacterized protein n=1 Tax=Cinchona calisaya TaxID=153742 RepID=A0ABD2YLG0_9GENT
MPEALSDFQSTVTQEHNSTIDERVEIQSSAQGCCSRTGNFCGGFADNGSSSSTKGLVQEDGPNVRIVNDPIKTAFNPMCIGVGLKDVDTIVTNFIGGCSELGLSDTS